MRNLLIVLGLMIVVSKLLVLYIEQRSLYHPTRRLVDTPQALHVRYEDVWLRTKDAIKLHAWYVPAPQSVGTMLFFHGNMGNISHRLHRIKFFRGLGLNALYLDYRGYGQSGGRPTEGGLYNDADAGYAYLLKEKKVDPATLVVYGNSLGGAVGAELCRRHITGALILESTFASTYRMAEQISRWLPWPWLLSQPFNTLEKVKKIAVPKLIVHGRYDEVIPAIQAEWIYAAASEPKQFQVFDGGHNDELYVTSEAYQRVVIKFLESRGITPRGRERGSDAGL